MTLRLMRGYPGSGKSTLAKEWVAEDEDNRRRVNRDDIRHMLFGRVTGLDECAVTRAQKALVTTFLRERKDVVVDDTNLKLRNLKNWVQVAYRHGHKVEIIDVTTPVGECQVRNINRDGMVPPEVIAKFAARYPMPWPVVDMPEVIEPDFRSVLTREKFGLPRRVIVDIDGTMALMKDRRPFDYNKVHTDLLNEPVDRVVRALFGGAEAAADAEVWPIFVSGRVDDCRGATEDWLFDHGWVVGDEIPLFMRKAGDDRADYVVKYEIFEREIRDKYDVVLVLDDRDQCVDMWRAIDLPTFQVNPGDF